jgi:hypothetical protein
LEIKEFLFILDKKKSKKTEFIFELVNFGKNGNFSIEFFLEKNKIAKSYYL